ncbi:M24 family metallopeptidase [Clostridium polynesiense]|uniref:M24 family metallopeptidase n=1 Tax=Clostridium polynesiense TaxID=1325933 RepID=UPI00058B350C|nr:M24 family metallopeptidase [Clostridium polynesiense]
MFDKYTVPREKVKQLEELLKENDIDALMSVSREGSDGILPFLIGDDTVHLGVAIFTKEGKHIMLTSKSDEKKFMQSGIFNKVVAYEKSLSEVLIKTIDEINPKKLALNTSLSDATSDGLTCGLYMMLQDMLGKERLSKIEVSSENVIRELRSVKSDTEVEYLRKSIQITNDIYDEVFTRVKCGMSEKEIGDIFIDCMRKRDVCNGIGKPYDYPIICIVRAGLAHRGPGDTKTIPGDILIMDFSVKYRGYISDIARTAYFLKPGETAPPEDIQHAFNTAHNAISAAIETIGVGKRGWEVDTAGRRVIEEGGYPTVRHSVGHPIGCTCHDSGTALAPFKGDENAPCNRPIKLNEVYAIEPTVIQDDGLPCMLVEENVVIRPEGAEILSRRQHQLYLISSEGK